MVNAARLSIQIKGRALLRYQGRIREGRPAAAARAPVGTGVDDPLIRGGLSISHKSLRGPVQGGQIKGGKSFCTGAYAAQAVGPCIEPHISRHPSFPYSSIIHLLTL